MLLSDNIEDWILNMENLILDTRHGPLREQRVSFEFNSTIRNGPGEWCLKKDGEATSNLSQARRVSMTTL